MSKTYNSKIYTWEDYDKDVSRIIFRLSMLSIKPKSVYGIPRGGLILAVSLSNKLNIPLLLSPTKDTIVCDDIADTGDTLHPYKSKYNTATLIYKITSKTIPTTYGRVHHSDEWIIFPWE